MKSKKFVLAGLALLAAITMVLLPLAGCKTEVDTSSPQQEQTKDTNDNAGTGDNDSTNTEDNTSGGGDSGTGGGDTGDNPSAGNDGENGTVPETPAAKLVSITVTTLPAQTVYSERQSFDPTGMVVTATYDDKSQREVTGWETDFNTVAGEKGLNKPVTVSYTEGETPKTTTFTVTVFPAEVKVLTGYTSPNNTDDSWTYVEFGKWPQTIKADSVIVGESEVKQMGMFTYYLGEDSNYYVKHSDKYYKVEPIVWRVLTTNYEVPEGGTGGEVLLLAEKILTGGIKWADRSNDYMRSYIRQWLNGNSWTGGTSDYGDDAGFLQTAFTQSDWELIADTTVDNSGAASTTDKIFLLSEQEATTSVYGFATESIEDSTRIRVTTDYANATGTEQNSSGHSGWWWLRSPYYNEGRARGISNDGDVNKGLDVNVAYGGVVPALSISLGGN